MSEQQSASTQTDTMLASHLRFETREEPGMSLSRRQWDRHLERIAKCKEGWNNLWLGAAMTFLGVGFTAAVGAVAIPSDDPTKPDQSHITDTTRFFLYFGAVVASVLFLVCLGAYLTRKRDRDSAIDEVIKDMKIHEPV